MKAYRMTKEEIAEMARRDREQREAVAEELRLENLSAVIVTPSREARQQAWAAAKAEAAQRRANRS